MGSKARRKRVPRAESPMLLRRCVCCLMVESRGCNLERQLERNVKSLESSMSRTSTEYFHPPSCRAEEVESYQAKRVSSMSEIGTLRPGNQPSFEGSIAGLCFEPSEDTAFLPGHLGPEPGSASDVRSTEKQMG